MDSANQYITIKPLLDEEESTGRTPQSALFLARGEVLGIGSEQCVLEGVLVRKKDLIPNLEIGATVYFRKAAEDRLNQDAAYRFRLPGDSISYGIMLKVGDVIACDPKPTPKE